MALNSLNSLHLDDVIESFLKNGGIPQCKSEIEGVSSKYQDKMEYAMKMRDDLYLKRDIILNSNEFVKFKHDLEEYLALAKVV